MKLGWGPEVGEFQTELRTFLDEHAPAEAAAARNFAASDHDVIPQWARDWQATLFDHGWMIPAYSPELGGRNATPTQTMVYLEEMARRGVPRSLHFPGYAIVAPSLLEFGTPEQQALAPAAIRGDTVWCIGMSEPNAGSDLAGLQTRAEVFDDRFVLNGQKVWTSYAMWAEKCFAYVRTDPNVPKHKGISLLIVDMNTPGIEIRPLRHISGSAEFAEVFFTEVEVPRDNLVGTLNDGWRLTQGSLAHERAGLWVDSLVRIETTISDLVALARDRGLDTDTGYRRAIASLYERSASLRALGYQGFAQFTNGADAPSEHQYMKFATSELHKECFELGMEMLGELGAVIDGEFAEAQGRWLRSYFVSFASTIAGGTSEIQRNIVAQRVLGLPRG
ncbi:MAG: acyl-CoA dehydrogenase family protein [Acidimicrobiia bacterium]